MTQGPSSDTRRDRQAAASKPWNPYFVLFMGIVLPGSGQVVNGSSFRGLLMLFYMVLLAAVSFHLTTPEHSVLGRYAGGWFIYAMSFMDAYRTARYRWAEYWYGVSAG